MNILFPGRRIAIALAALLLLRADMYPDASNAKLPEAQQNLGITTNALCGQAGVTCDGTTDDSAAINALLTANPGTYVIPRGKTIAIGSTINFRDNYTGLVCEGGGASFQPGTVEMQGCGILKWTGAAGGTVISTQPNPGGPDGTSLFGVKFAGVGIQCDGANTAAIGIHAVETSQSIFDSLFIRGCSDAGIKGGDLPTTVQANFRKNMVSNIECNVGANLPGDCFKGYSTAGAVGNVNNNEFRNVRARLGRGTGLNIMGADTNVFINIGASHNGTDQGSSLVFGSTRNPLHPANNSHVVIASSGRDEGGIIVGGTGGVDGVCAGTAYTSVSGAFNEYDIGSAITGTNIAPGTTVAAVITSKKATLSQACTVDGSGLTWEVAGRTASNTIQFVSVYTSNQTKLPTAGTGATFAVSPFIGNKNVSAGGTYDVSVEENGATYSNSGATSEVAFRLPPVKVGMRYCFANVMGGVSIRAFPRAGEFIQVPGLGDLTSNMLYSTATKGAQTCLVARQAGGAMVWGVASATQGWSGTLYTSRAPSEFGAKCDIQTYIGGGTWTAGGTSFTPANGITPTAADIGKKLVLYGAGAGGTTYSGTITAAAGAAWTVDPAIPNAPARATVYGIALPTTPAAATGYAPGDTIVTTGGTTTGGSQATLRVKWTKVNSTSLPTIVSPGSGGQDGSVILTGTTGRGLYFRLLGTISGGALTAITGVDTYVPNPTTGAANFAYSGIYHVNPTNPANEPVVPVSDGTILTNTLTGAALSLKMVPAQLYVDQRGAWSTFPTNPVSQGSTSGSGVGAQFNLTAQAAASTGNYGRWYYGTDDTAAIQAAADWADSNGGVVKWAHRERCGISAQISIDGDYATFEGTAEGSRAAGVAHTGKEIEGLYWVGNANPTAAMLDISTPDGAVNIVGNAVNRLGFVCANLAGRGIRIRSMLSGGMHQPYIEQCTSAAIELQTNTNASPPTDQQGMLLVSPYMDQQGTNGVMMRVGGTPAVATGSPSQQRIIAPDGLVGFETPYELGYTDHTYWDGMRGGALSYNGVLLCVDWGTVPTAGGTLGNTNGHRVHNGINCSGPSLFRGTQSSGVADEFVNNIWVDDSATKNSYRGAIFEPPGQRVMNISYINNASYAMRDLSENTSSSLSLGAVAPPVKIGSANTTGVPAAVAVQGNYVYIVSAAACGLEIFDLTIPAKPQQVSCTGTTHDAKGIAVSGRYAYVSTWDLATTTATLRIYDIGNPSVPAATGSVVMPLNSGGRLVLSGNHAIVGSTVATAGKRSFAIVDVSTPAAPTVTSETSPSTGIPIRVRATADGKYVLAFMNGGANFYVYDKTNPAVPALVSTNALAGNVTGDAVLAGRYAYLQAAGAAMAVADLKNFAAPVVTAPSVAKGFTGIVAAGRYLYGVAVGGLNLYDISLPTYPQYIGATATSSTPVALAMSGRYLISAGSAAASGLEIFKASGADLPAANIGMAGTLQ